MLMGNPKYWKKRVRTQSFIYLFVFDTQTTLEIPEKVETPFFSKKKTLYVQTFLSLLSELFGT